MNDKKFDALSIIISITAFLLAFFCNSFESVIAGATGLVLAIKRRKQYRTKIAIALSIFAIVLGVGFFALLCYHYFKYGSMTDYWFFELLFGKMAE